MYKLNRLLVVLAVLLLAGCPNNNTSTPAPTEPAPTEPAPNEPAPNEPGLEFSDKATAAGLITIPEGGNTEVGTFLAKSSKALTYALDGADKGKFRIDEKTGLLSFKTAPDFEAKASAAKNNDYKVTVKVTDGSSTIERALTVRVTDVDEKTVSATPTGLKAKDAAGALITGLSSEPIATLEATAANAADNKVTFYNNGTALGAAVTALSGTATFTPKTPLGTGSYVITAKARESGKELSAASDPLRITIDTAIPDAPTALTLKAGSRTVSGATTSEYVDSLAATATTGQTVVFYANTDSNKLGEAVAAGGGAATLELRGDKSLFDGVYNIYAKARSSGKFSAATATRKITINSTPTNLRLFAGAVEIPSTTFTTSQEVDIIEVDTVSGRRVIFYNGSTKLGEATGHASTGKARLTLSPPLAVQEAAHKITAKAQHSTDKFSPATAVRSITVSAPGVSGTPGDFKFYSGSSRLTPPTLSKAVTRITAKAAPGALVQFKNNDVNLQAAVTADGATGLATLSLSPSLKNGAHKISATAKEATKTISPASTAITLNVSGVGADSTPPALNSQGGNPPGFPVPAVNSRSLLLNFNEALLYADSSKITVKEGSRVLPPTAVGLDPEDNTRLVIEIARIGNLGYQFKASTAYTVELAAGAVADLAGNLSTAPYSRSQTTARTDTYKPRLRILKTNGAVNDIDNNGIRIYIDESVPVVNFQKVSFYSLDKTETRLTFGTGTAFPYISFPGYNFRVYTVIDGYINIRYAVSRSNFHLLPPKGTYKLVFAAGTFTDRVGNSNDKITYIFNATGDHSLAMFGDNKIIGGRTVYTGSLFSTGAKNLTIKFTKAIKLPAGKKKQVFIEKKTGSSWNVVLNADGDFSAAVGTDEKNLVLSTRGNLAAGTYRVRVELEAVQAKVGNEYLFERAYTSEVTIH